MPSRGTNEQGATAVEYALFLALIALVIIVAFGQFAATVRDLFVADWPW